VSPLSALQPRNAAEAADSAVVLSLVASVVSVVFAMLAPDVAGGRLGSLLITAAALALVLLAGWSGHGAPGWAVRAASGWPLGCVLVGALLAVGTHDPSGWAQVFFGFAVLYGGSQLRRPGAVEVTSVVVMAEFGVLLSLVPPRRAALEFGCLLAVLLATSAVLVLAGERNEELLRQLQQLQALDPVTGLVTRQVLDTAAGAALARTAERGGTALILVDVDGFRELNDEYGHAAGDQVLRQLSRILVSLTRSEDVVARLGGDVIAVLLPGCAAEAARRRAEQLLFTVRGHPFQLSDGRTLTVSFTAGVAHCSAVALEARGLYRAAWAALEQAKRARHEQVEPPEASLGQ